MPIRLDFLKRRPELDHADFVDQWTGPFADEVRRRSPWTKPNPDVLRHAQHILMPTEGWAFDGFAETWFPTTQAAESVESSEYLQRSYDDAGRTFLDLDGRVSVWDDQHVVAENLGAGGEQIVIMLSFYKRRPDWSHDKYVDYWTGEYAAKWRKGPWAKPNPHIVRYVQHVLTPTEGWDYDGFSENWFSSPASVKAVLATDDFKHTLKVEVPKFLDPAGAISVWEQQRVLAQNVGELGAALSDDTPVQYPPPKAT